MKFCSRPFLAVPSILVGVFASAFWTAAASAQPAVDISIEERGQAAALEMTLDEVQIKRFSEQPNGLLKMTAEALLPGSSVFEDTGSTILVKLGNPLDRANAAAHGDSVTAAFPEAEVAPVLYMKGAPHERPFRRIGTSDVQVVMLDGRSPEDIQALAGAKSVRRTRVDNVIILGFDNPYQAIERSQTLQAKGVRANPVMRRYFEKHALPQDEFFGRQWHLLNLGQNNGKVGVDINVLNAWDITLGGNSTIAVIDDGVETKHPDLDPNCPPVNSKLHHDFRDNDDDPKPNAALGDGHGTCVAGLAAAAQNNGVPDINTGLLTGVSGVAPSARILGLRLIGGATTDEEAGDALYWHPLGANVAVSNNSYGYSESIGLVGADVLERAALRDAALLGRDGRGIVTCFSAGNGRFNEANANFATEQNSRYVVTVGAINSFGFYSSYSTPGASLLVCAPGGEFGTFGINQRLTTTDVTGTGGFNPTQFFSSDGGSDVANIDYTNEMNGTSSASPITAGTAALMLSANANPTLGWRDVKEILASTARRIDETNPSWQMRPDPLLNLTPVERTFNGANFKFSNDYGAGLIDATAAVTRALTWTNLSQEVSQSVRVTTLSTQGFIPDDSTVASFDFDFSGKQNLRAEQIEVELRIDHPVRGDLRIDLVSPAGTRSSLAVPRAQQLVFSNKDYADIVLTGGILDTRSGGWTFTTTHHWGENTAGVWHIEITDENAYEFNYGTPANPIYLPPTLTTTTGNGSKGRVVFGEIRLYGTTSGPERVVIDQQHYAYTEPGVPSNQDVIVRRLGPTTSTFTVEYHTTVGTASPNLDFTPVNGTLTFNPGDTMKTISVPILPDVVPESTETINVVLTNLNTVSPTTPGSNVSFGGITMATIDIIDDETQFVSVEAVDARAAETHQGLPKDPGNFVVSRSKVTDQPLTVFLSYSGTATPGNGNGDYQVLPAQVVIPAFERSVVIPVQPYDDGLFEGAETVVATLIPDPTYSIGVPGTDTVNIIDNDRPKVQIGILNNDRIASESTIVPPPDTASFRISRDLVTDQPLTVFLRFGGTQIVGLNYKLTYVDANTVTHEITDPLNAGVVIEANEAFTDVTLVPLNDDIYQVTKSALVGLQPNDAYDFSFGFLTQVAITILEDDPKLDTVLPAVSITSPKNNIRVESPVTGPTADVTIMGRATDNQAAGLKRLSYRVNGAGTWIDIPGAPGTQSFDWTVVLHQADVLFGPNTFEIKATDIALNESKIAVIKFYYAQLRTLATSVNGGGSITNGFIPSSAREVGTKVVLTARAAAGQVFDKWTLTPAGDMPINYAGRSLTFLMPNKDATLTANFVPSPFVPEIAGEYNGLIKPGTFTFEGTGFLHITVGPLGTFTGQLTYAGQVYPLKTEFSGSGRYTAQIERRTSTPLTVDLTIDLNVAGSKKITGTVTTATGVSTVSADRAAYSKTVPAPANLVKSYTLLFPQSVGAGMPQGTGNATMKIDAAGKVTWTGHLPDGTVVKQSVPLTKDGTWPLFLNLYNKRGVMLGVMTHEALANSDLDGNVDWRRPADQKAKMFQAGFTIPQVNPAVPQIQVVGSEYTPPVAGARVITNISSNSPNANTKLDFGNLLTPIPQQITLDTANKVTVNSTSGVNGVNGNRLALKINATTGGFTGTFIHPVSNKRVSLYGVIFQKTSLGYGAFIGSSVPGAVIQTGIFTITPIP